MKHIPLDDEKKVVQSAKNGNKEAFGVLVKHYQKRAYSIAYGFLGNREDALETAQDSFVKAFKAMNRFDTSFPFYPWFYRIVKNTCLNRIKKKKRRGESSLDLIMDKGVDFEGKEKAPDHRASLGELRHTLNGALERVSASHREIITLRHIQELSYTEIADCLGIPKGTVMSRLHGARNSLKKALETT